MSIACFNLKFLLGNHGKMEKIHACMSPLRLTVYAELKHLSTHAADAVLEQLVEKSPAINVCLSAFL